MIVKVNEDLAHGTHIAFTFLSQEKTCVWRVESKSPGMRGYFLGTVKWFGRWRGYAFFPEGGTVFEKVCLREIADFCECETQEHMRLRRLVKAQTSVLAKKRVAAGIPCLT